MANRPADDHGRQPGNGAVGVPEMLVSFRRLSLAADITTPAATPGQDKVALLPTVANQLLTSITSLATKRTTVRKQILSNVSGCFKPGTLTLVLGQPGSGKSALMKVLSGRFPLDKHIKLDGDVQYNGVVSDQLGRRLPQFVSYVTQHDKHMATLTVDETLQFAYECSGGLTHRSTSKTAKAPDSSDFGPTTLSRDPDQVVAELGLGDCRRTVIGNAMLRGVSGGERKRVTTGEMQFGQHAISFMDEISTGLDSAAAFDIISTQRSVAKKWGKTIVISLLQPSPEVFDLFDNILLLNEGEVMYNGPRSQVLAYFESLGFVRPPHRDVADFLCDLGTNAQTQYEQGTPPVGHAHCPRAAAEFAKQWEASSAYAVLESDLDALAQTTNSSLMEEVAHVPEFYQSFWRSTWTLTKRQATLVIRDVPLVAGRIFMAVFCGLLFGSLFYQVDLTDGQVFMGLVFAAVLYLGLGQTSMLAPFMEARDVFYKQRAANFYRTSSYVIATCLSHVPLMVGESIVFGAIVYWMSGFVADASAFILYEVFLIFISLVFLVWFFFLAAATPNLHVAEPISMISLLIMIIFAGFVITKENLPNFLSWLYWINPVAWAMHGIVVGQYRSGELDKCVYNGYDYCANQNGKTMGQYELNLFSIAPGQEWVGYSIIFLVAVYVVVIVLAYFALEYKRFEHPEHVVVQLEDSTDTDTKDGRRVSADPEYAMLQTPRERVVSTEVSIPLPANNASSVQRVTVAFDDLRYSVPTPGGSKSEPMLKLLKGVTGYALPGTMTALMGSTGAGKTTLMDVIAGRKTGGKIEGRVLLNGVQATDLAVRRCTGYCEQMDVHSDGSTFREALTFSAFLRQGQEVSTERILDSVNESIELLGLEDIADHIVRGSSAEQMKRLTIGVELAAQPSVLFLDEPTSGLDARSAKLIMDGVRRVADSGRTVVCTIHQPSSEVFFVFDNLLLLQRGGHAVYFGELGHKGSAIVDYFEAMPGVEKIPDGYNPATWMLEVIGAGVQTDKPVSSEPAIDFVAAFDASATKRRLDEARATPGVFEPSDDVAAVVYQKKRAASNWMQFKLLLQRFFRLYWRTPSYSLMRLIIPIFLALVFGIIYVNAEYRTYAGVNAGLGMMYVTTAFIGVLSSTSVLPIAAGERAPFYRERASQTYNAFWYFVVSSLVEIPYAVVTALLYTAIFFPMVGFTGFNRFLIYWATIVLHIVMQTYSGQLVSFALPSIEVAQLAITLLDTFCFMFMGFNPPASAIPAGYKWIYAIGPHRYIFAILSSLVFGECSDDQVAQVMATLTTNGTDAALELAADWPMGCRVLLDAPPAVGDVPTRVYIEEVFGAKHAHMTQYVGIFLAIMAVFRIFTALSMRFINHQKR